MKMLYNDARKEYISLIFNAKKLENERTNDINGFYEKHHIFPKSIFPNYEFNSHNLVLLTYKEHFMAHKLLCEILPCYKMKMAFGFMCTGKNRNVEILTAEDYEKSKLAYKEAWSLLSDEEKKKSSIKRYNTMIERYGIGFKEIKEKEKITRAAWTEERHKQYQEKYNNTLKNHTEEEHIAYSESRKHGGNAANTPEAKLKRKETCIKKYGGNGGVLNNKDSLEKFRNTLKNRSIDKTNKWKEKVGNATRGKKFWTNGKITIRSFEKPGDDFVLGRIINIKNHSDVSRGKNPKAIHIIELSENKEFDCIKDFCDAYNIKISKVRKYAIKINEKFWKIDITKIK